MPLVGHETFYRYVQDRRIVYIGGKLGGGKTSLAFRIAWDLMQTGRFRYIISNVNSVWNEDPSDVILRDGVKVDAVVILDEAGDFMRTEREARQWIRNLRKINVVLILPSFDTPASVAKAIAIENTFNGYGIFIPYYRYTGKLKSTTYTEDISFGWWKPHEIYGIYDTDGFPSDNAPALLQHLERWQSEASKALGYGGDDGGTDVHSATLETLEEIERQLDRLNQV
ncbi:MAG: hypothetical protein AAF846_11160 [Chloroflexota bacterium]